MKSLLFLDFVNVNNNLNLWLLRNIGNMKMVCEDNQTNRNIMLSLKYPHNILFRGRLVYFFVI